MAPRRGRLGYVFMLLGYGFMLLGYAFMLLGYAFMLLGYAFMLLGYGSDPPLPLALRPAGGPSRAHPRRPANPRPP
jgi:hypothetical protein